MPSTYAHFYFGEQVAARVGNDLQQLIFRKLPYYQIGLHGPDILFYYKPFSTNPVNQTGVALHRQPAEKFLAAAPKAISKSGDPEAATDYILGFICHFMLDSECHPYVNDLMEATGLSHYEIETEFERTLMLKNKLDPLSYRPTGHLTATPEIAECIACFFEEYGVSAKQIRQSVKSMRLYLNLLVTPKSWQRSLVSGALKISGSYETMKGLLMNRQPNPLCSEGYKELSRLLEEAVKPTADLITEYYQNLTGNNHLNIRFARDFD